MSIDADENVLQDLVIFSSLENSEHVHRVYETMSLNLVCTHHIYQNLSNTRTYNRNRTQDNIWK